ncbi:MAG: ribosome hibernation-promoting factor, HPF/YfiA family [Acidobacteriaceae bacterium]
MQTEYTGRQVVVSKKLRTQTEAGLARLERVLGKTCSAHIILTAEKYRKIAEVSVQTRQQTIVGIAESTDMEMALRDALGKAEKQALRFKNRIRAKKRQPKEEKQTAAPVTVRVRRTSRVKVVEHDAEAAPAVRAKKKASPSNGRTRASVPVVVHSFPAKALVTEPHIVRSRDSVALRPMTLEEAVKEAEFRDRDVFVFRDNHGGVKVLHRKKDGKMELIEAP